MSPLDNIDPKNKKVEEVVWEDAFPLPNTIYKGAHKKEKK